MKIEIRSSFVRDTKKCTQKIKDKITEAIHEIFEAQSLSDLKNIKELKGGKDAKYAYRMRIDDYRICFYYRDDSVELVRVLPRKTVYRSFP